jgi:hypothetical protein
MIDFILLLTGIALVLIVMGDFFYTVFIPRGAGLLTGIINVSVSNLFKLVTGNKGTNRLLEFTWLAILLVMLITWVSLMWIGFTLIYNFEFDSILHGQDKIPASFIEKLYFTGYALSTLGIGDYVPQGYIWQILTSFVSLTGFFMMTIGITYLVPVIHNIIEKNILSQNISDLGSSSNAIVIQSFNGDNFHDITEQFTTLSNMILGYSKNHLAYPILHYVHNSHKNENAILNLVSLDEALTIFMHHVPESLGPSRIVLRQMRKSIDSYLSSVKNVESDGESPPLPDFESLGSSLHIKLENTEEHEIKALYNNLKSRRQLLRAVVQHDGWDWDDVNWENNGKKDESY